MDIVQIKRLKKYFGEGARLVKALDGVTLSMEKGKFTAVVGASGSGKTTLLNLIGGLYTATKRNLILNGNDPARLKENPRPNFRRPKGPLRPGPGAGGLRRVRGGRGFVYFGRVSYGIRSKGGEECREIIDVICRMLEMINENAAGRMWCEDTESAI